MKKNNFVSLVSFLFLIIGAVHALRLLNGWSVEVGGFMVPAWASWVAALLAFYLAWNGFRVRKFN